MTEDWWAESARAVDRLTRARGQVNDAANVMNHTLGGVMEFGGVTPKLEQTLGPRISKFATADLDDLLSCEDQRRLAVCLAALVPFRNRLHHDQWDVVQDSVGNWTGQVVGYGEEWWTNTNLDSVETIARTFSVSSDAIEDFYSALAVRALMDAELPAEMRERFITAVEGAVAEVTTAPRSGWLWDSRRSMPR